MSPLSTVSTPDGIGVVVPPLHIKGLPHHYRGWVMVMFADGERNIYDPANLEVLYTPEAAVA